MEQKKNIEAGKPDLPVLKQEDILVKAEHIPEFDHVVMIAEKLFKSGLFKHLNNGFQAVAIVEFGREMGVQPMQSLQLMAVISGKLAVQAQLMLALAKKKGCDVEIVESTSSKCEIWFIRGGKKHKVSFTYKEAKDLNLTYKDNWKKQPANMLFWRCISRAIRRHAPDLILGAYSIEEVTEGEYSTVEELQKISSNQEENPIDVIHRLLEQKDIPQENRTTIEQDIVGYDDKQLKDCVAWLESQPDRKPSTAKEVLANGKKENGSESSEAEKQGEGEGAEEEKEGKPEPKKQPKNGFTHDAKLTKKFIDAYRKCYAKDKGIEYASLNDSEQQVINKLGANKLKKMSDEEANTELERMLGALK